MALHAQIATMVEQQLRELAAQLIEKVAQQDREIRSKAEAIERDHRELHRPQVKIDQLAHEMAVLTRWTFGGAGVWTGSLVAQATHLLVESDRQAPAGDFGDGALARLGRGARAS